VLELGITSLLDLARPSARKRIRAAVESSEPDIIHAHMYHAEIVAAAASSMTDIPLVVTRHSAGLEFNGSRRILSRLAGRRIRRIIAVSDEAAGEAVSMGAPAGSVITIPNGVDTSRFSPAGENLRKSERSRLMAENFTAGGGEGLLLVGAVSGLKPVKDFPVLVRALASLDEARLIIAGEGPSREELETLAESLGMESRVSFPGHTDRPEEILPFLDIFVLPSRSEGVPIALLEAMSCGLACVATGVGGIPGVLDGCGVLFEPGDAGALASILAGLSEDPGARAGMGRRARVRALERFDIEIWGSRTVAVYEDMLC
jgi:glycosyltransferase involved in cell wall biosynthesis